LLRQPSLATSCHRELSTEGAPETMGRPKSTIKEGPKKYLVLLVLVAGALMLLLPGPALGADSSASFSLEPASPSSQTSGYFIMSGTPGQQLMESAVLRNLSQQTITVSLAAVDGATGQYGGVTYGLPQDPVKKVGAWISLDQTQVVLKPGDSVEIPFTISVPADAPTGMSVGGIAAWIPAATESSTTSEGFSAQIIIQTRRVIAVQVNLPGDSEPVLEISGVTPVARASGMALDIAITNTGHGLASGKGSIDVPSADFHKDFALEDVLPGTSVSYPIVWSENPEQRKYDARVSISYNGKSADWSGSFSVGQTAVSELLNRSTSTTVNAQRATSGSKLSLGVIIAIIAGAVAWLIIVAGAVLLVLRRAKRRRAPGVHRPEAGSPPGSGDGY
jgi:hypothetical protein